MRPETAARDAIAWVRAHYDEEIFPPRPKGPHTEVYDSEAAVVARLICDNILQAFEKRLAEEDEVDEVEVTTDDTDMTNEQFDAVLQHSQQVAAFIVVPPKLQRRSGARNVSSPTLQNAFIDEARFAMGQPSQATVESLVSKRIRLVFNFEQDPVTGTLTEIVHHPAATYLVLDSDHQTMYPVNSIQSIEEA